MSTEVKPGYKQTELGTIPEDWDVRPLGQLVHAVEYGSSAKSSSSGKVPVLRMGNLQEGQIDWSDLVFTDNESEIAKYLLNPGDVLFNRTNTIDLVGKTAIYKGVRPSIFAGYLIRIKEKKDQIDSRYLNYLLNSKPAKNYGLKVLSIAVGQANINGQKLKTYPIALPPTVDEQNSIATAISEIEEFISSLDQLIAKKRDIQQAAMQQLLPGQRRLPGFSGAWDVKPMRALGNTYGGLTGKTKKDFGHGEARYIPFMNVMTDTVIDASWLEPVDVASDEAQNLAKKGDLFFNGSSETPEEVGFCSVLLEEIPNLYLNSFCFGFRFNAAAKVNGLFFAYWFRSKAGRAAMAVLAQGATRYNIAKSAFLQLEIPQPSEEEQTAIASILSDMDTELAALEARRDKARQLKQGMMQELLTGRIRLV
ncbi:restriction endonuclease subunit S [Pseudomonas aeruginosa]|nr:restriction endonuclease subunit S [Pseudomonas aeruginosa]MCT1237847.1 restriction endonuclease subunit S [Pseudomonas aeruginosa]